MRLLRKPKSIDQLERKRPDLSTRPTVFSYYARSGTTSETDQSRRDEAKPSRMRAYRLKFGHLPSYLALLTILIALGYATLLQPSPRIVLVHTSGTIHREPKAYQDGIKAIWKSSILNRTKFTVSTLQLTQKIQNQFAEIGSVNIQLPLLGRRSTVVLTPASPALQLVSITGIFYVDHTGKVMAETKDVTQNELKDLPLVNDQSGLRVEPSKNILSAAETEFLDRLYRQLKAAHLEVVSITLPKNGAQQADVKITGQDYTIKFSLLSDARQAVGTYLALKSKLDGDHVVPKEYVDVRVEEKAFYK